MLICHCQGITDRKIRDEIARGARTVGQIARTCGAAGSCGGCAKAVAEIVEESRFRALPTMSSERMPSPALAAE